MLKIAIVGFGLMGRVLALSLLQKIADINLTVFDKEPLLNSNCCGYAGAGMVCPYTELMTNEPTLYQQGRQSAVLWQKILKPLKQEQLIWQPCGSLLLAHQLDHADFSCEVKKIFSHMNEVPTDYILTQDSLQAVEPELNYSKLYHTGLKFNEEGLIHPGRFFKATATYFLNCAAVNYQQQQLSINNILQLKAQYDWVIDSRGLGAQDVDHHLLGVRGEAMLVQADQVNISHIIRLFHPQKTIYIAPHGNRQYYLGATSIYSRDNSAISLKSLLELGTAAYAIHSGFAEARLVRTVTALRPSYQNGLPKIERSDNLWRINGLYRHGYLLSPVLAKQLVDDLIGMRATVGAG